MLSSVSGTGLAALAVLVLQNTSLVLLMRLAVTSGSGFISSTAVCCDEAMKLVSCTLVMIGYYIFKVPSDYGCRLPTAADNPEDCTVQAQRRTGKSLEGLYRFFKREVFGQGLLEVSKMAVPAFCYAVQKNFLYVALAHLEAAVYQVVYQAKILTTALFSCLILRKPMSYMQVLALSLLMVGVGCVQLSAMEDASEKPQTTNYRQFPLLGLLAVAAACSTSGFSSVYFEMVIKTRSFAHSGVDQNLAQEFALWVRNIQLAMFSLTAALIGAFLKDGAQIMEGGFLQGYTPLTWMVVVLEASGGIVVALVIKYTDNILKNFATAISIVSSTAISCFIMGFSVKPVFILGTCAVLGAITMYQRNPPTKDNECLLGFCQKKVSVSVA